MSDPQALQANLSGLEQSLGAIEVIGHRSVPVPGTAETVDVRAQDPEGAFGAPMLARRAGRYPVASDEVAVTDEVAATFGVRVGDRLPLGGVDRTVVGLVENPADLSDEFALVAPSPAAPPQSVTVLAGGRSADFAGDSGKLRSGDTYSSERRGSTEKVTAAVVVLMLATVVLLLICLVAAAGFAVVAQRRLRQLGMLAAVGATSRHLRLVMVADGFVVGLIAAVTGNAIALGAWLSVASRLETAAGHRIDRFDVPWWLLGAGLLLAVVTATAAAWWPARTAARIPITQALSARPPRPRPAHRSAAAAAVLLALGFVALAMGIDTVKDKANPALLIAGTLAIVVGILFVSPLAIQALAAPAGRLPISARLAVRDLARHQARSGSALAAISLALGIAVATVVLATTAQDRADAGNLSDRQLLVRMGDPGPLVPAHTPAEVDALRAQVERIAASLDEPVVVPLDAAVDLNDQESVHGQAVRPAVLLARRISDDTFRDAGFLYVATPELLGYLGLDPASIDPDADVLTPQVGELGLVNVSKRSPAARTPPHVQSISVPGYSSAPASLITATGLSRGGWQPAPAGWLVESARPLTSAQRLAARTVAADAGLTVEARRDQSGLAAIRTVATAAGLFVALSILAMTVGLIRSEAGRDLQTLTATGATSTTRRALTAATAAALALLGAALGILGAYIALIAGYLHDLDRLRRVPFLQLGIILIGLPALAGLAGWLLAGREPPALDRRPLD